MSNHIFRCTIMIYSRIVRHGGYIDTAQHTARECTRKL